MSKHSGLLQISDKNWATIAIITITCYILYDPVSTERASMKKFWKLMMYADPTWYLYGRFWGSEDSDEAADEYEEEILPALGCLGGVLIVSIAIAILLHWI